MKKEFEEYLRAINMPNSLIERIETIFPYIELLCPEEIVRLFVTDYVQEDGAREYESVLFFSKDFICEAKQFVTENDIDVTPINKRIFYITLKTQDYDLKNATEKSRIYAKVFFEEGPPTLNFDLKASKENCAYAVQMLSDILVPNLVR